MKKNVLYRIISSALVLCLISGGFIIPVFAAYENTYKNTGDGKSDIVGVAATQIGYAEGKSGYTKYGEAMGNSTMDWCCAFVVWCARQAGIGSDIIPNTASCSAMYSMIDSSLIKKSASQGSSYVPSAGDLIFFKNLRHIGIVSGVSNSEVYVIEGNCSDLVKKRTYKLSSSEIIAYASPDYSQKNVSGLIFQVDTTTRVRSSASTSGSVLGQVTTGSTIYVQQITSDNWGLISYNGKDGWVCLDWSTFSSGNYTTSEVTIFRASASYGGTKIDSIPKGTTLTVTKISSDNWGYVQYSGSYGWICLEPGADRDSNDVNWLMIDISKWNTEKSLDWDKLKSAGVKAVIIRIGGRTVNSKKLYSDDTFVEHYKAAKAAGMHVGAYFFSYALTTSQAKAEAQLTIDILQKNNCELDMPVFIDIEDYAESDGSDYQHYKAGRAVCTNVVNTFCDAIEEAGYYPGIYCTKSFATDLIKASAFTGRAVWIAQYGVSKCSYSSNFDCWQYTRSGKISGCSTKIDLSRCYTNFPAIIAKMNTQEEIVEPVEDNTVTDTETSYGEHKAGEWKTVTASTCTKAGTKQKTCTECSIVLEEAQIPIAEHNASVTCIQLLKTTIKAGDVLTSTQISSLHKETDSDYKTLMYESAWETQGGTKLTYCKTCKTVISAEYSYTSCSHSTTKTVTTKAATCTEYGVKEIQCTDCGNALSSSLVSPVAHTFGKTTRTSCTEEGTQDSVCSVCGNIYSSTYAEATTHTYTWKTQKAVSCIEDGTYIGTCSVCGYTTTKTVSSPMYGDVDSDKKITSSDARLVLRASVGLESLTEAEFAAADSDVNGKIEAADARILLRISVGLDSADELFALYYPDAKTE